MHIELFCFPDWGGRMAELFYLEIRALQRVDINNYKVRAKET